MRKGTLILYWIDGCLRTNEVDTVLYMHWKQTTSARDGPVSQTAAPQGTGPSWCQRAV
jgi:hypothetical protein